MLISNSRPSLSGTGATERQLSYAWIRGINRTGARAAYPESNLASERPGAARCRGYSSRPRLAPEPDDGTSARSADARRLHLPHDRAWSHADSRPRAHRGVRDPYFTLGLRGHLRPVDARLPHVPRARTASPSRLGHNFDAAAWSSPSTRRAMKPLSPSQATTSGSPASSGSRSNP